MGGGGERLYGDVNEEFYKKKWGENYEKKTGGLSRAAARTGKVR